MSQKPIFISYSHDSEEHKKQVLALSERLRQDGIETRLDQYPNGSPAEGWPRWMLNQLDEAQFVLVICTETYYRRFRGHEQPGKGKGVDWEGALITQELYDSRSKTLKFVPVFLNAAVDAHIPEPLRSTSYYALTSEKNYQNLYDFLLGQAGVEPHPVGTLKIRPRQQGTALTFDEPRSADAVKIDISRIDKYAPAELIGRESETKVLNDAWKQAISGEPKRPHVLTFVALGGEGKTSLVAKWAAELAHDNWQGCEVAFAWSFYSQGTHEAASSDLFLKEALVFFGDEGAANSTQGAYEKGRRLAQLVGERRALLILDGVEPLQYAPTSPMPGELKDHGIAALLKGLAANNSGLCVVTTRYSISDLKNYWETTAPKIDLKRLSKEAGVDLLKSLDVTGSQTEFDQLVEDVRGHALTLNLLGAYLRDAHAGDIRKRDLVKLADADDEQGGHAFRVMDAYAQWFENGGKNEEENKKGRRALAVLRLLGLFDRPASADCFGALLKAPPIKNLTELLVEKNEAKRNMALTRLEAAKLLTVNRNTAGMLLSLDTHPLLREYFAKQIREQYPNSWREAHRKLYKHLISTTNEGSKPTLEDLQPLYQAVAHGCQAGMLDDACEKIYRDRIQRRRESYSAKKLGAFGSDLGAVACFFEQPWNQVSPALTGEIPAWLLHEAALRLFALGRLTEAADPMRAGIKMARKALEESVNDDIRLHNLKQLAVRASSLSDLELTLGELGSALVDAEQAVAWADESGDAFQKTSKRTTYACALHNAGRKREAEKCFHEAEEMQVKRQTNFPFLYSIGGFRYCDFLLVIPERMAWQSVLGIGARNSDTELDIACRAVSERAIRVLQLAEQGLLSLLDNALAYLALSRATLYAIILEGASPRTCHESLRQALDALRCAGYRDYLLRGLLTRAWLRSFEGDHVGSESAQTDLDEALEIAERGPMPLFMADIHLYRARLFFREATYPWESPQADLAEARRLIEKHGYWRRKEELEDAESVILHKS